MGKKHGRNSGGFAQTVSTFGMWWPRPTRSPARCSPIGVRIGARLLRAGLPTSEPGQSHHRRLRRCWQWAASATASCLPASCARPQPGIGTAPRAITCSPIPGCPGGLTAWVARGLLAADHGDPEHMKGNPHHGFCVASGGGGSVPSQTAGATFPCPRRRRTKCGSQSCPT